MGLTASGPPRRPDRGDRWVPSDATGSAPGTLGLPCSAPALARRATRARPSTPVRVATFRGTGRATGSLVRTSFDVPPATAHLECPAAPVRGSAVRAFECAGEAVSGSLTPEVVVADTRDHPGPGPVKPGNVRGDPCLRPRHARFVFSCSTVGRVSCPSSCAGRPSGLLAGRDSGGVHVQPRSRRNFARASSPCRRRAAVAAAVRGVLSSAMRRKLARSTISTHVLMSVGSWTLAPTSNDELARLTITQTVRTLGRSQPAGPAGGRTATVGDNS